MKVLVIVDVQKDFEKFIQGDLVDELYEYAEKFHQVYQIWDTHKTDVAPTYKFPNQVDSVKKKYGKNSFSDEVKEFIKSKKQETFEGNTFKLSDNKGYVVRVDNNHEWFYVNPEIVELIEKLKNQEIILVGGADNECLEDVYQAFKAFGLNVKINKKYVYSAKTNQNDSVEDTVNEAYDNKSNINNSGPLYKIKVWKDFIVPVEHYFLNNNFKWIGGYNMSLFDSVLKSSIEDLSYIYFIVNGDTLSWCPPDDRHQNSMEIKNESDFNRVLNIRPSYAPRRIVRTLESLDEKSSKYRIKTEKEFEKEFGADWRHEVPLKWSSPRMDSLLGKPITINDEIPKEYQHKWSMDVITRVSNDSGGWNISWDMLTDNKPIEPSYKPKKFDRTLENILSFDKWIDSMYKKS